ncbi:PepSY domain-containing protein [Dongia sp.]|uniref:PepSY domain-containing protein n=1 Tax=Dongia sp. TaxID=1977262 RepID=UPI0035B40DFD
MWKITLSAAVFFGLSSLPVVVGLALASDDHSCRAPQGVSAMSREAAAKFGESLGYRITKIETEHGCYELSGTDKHGAEIELTLNPYDGNVVKNAEVAQ